MLEWPRFNIEIKKFDPLNITISFVGDNDKRFSECRKISLLGSVNWSNRLKDQTIKLDMSK